jgi:hypothetical protein
LRDAVDRAQRAVTDAKKPGEELGKLYEQASLVGDELLGYAVFRRALELGLSGGFVNEHLDAHGLREAYEVVNARDDGSELLDRAFDTRGPSKPSELVGQRVSLR